MARRSQYKYYTLPYRNVGYSVLTPAVCPRAARGKLRRINQTLSEKVFALKGLDILAQGNALGTEEKGITSPERARYSEVADGTTVYPALSGLDTFTVHPQGLAMNQSLVPRHGTRQALGWYISPRWGFFGRALVTVEAGEMRNLLVNLLANLLGE